MGIFDQPITQQIPGVADLFRNNTVANYGSGTPIQPQTQDISSTFGGGYTPFSGSNGTTQIPQFNFSLANTPVSNELGLSAPSTGANFTLPGTDPTTGQDGLKLLGPDGVLIPGLNALSGLAGAYTGLQQYGLQKEAFDLTKDLTKTNLFNQAQVTNSQIEDKARAAAIASGRDTPAGLDAARKQADQRKIRGTF